MPAWPSQTRAASSTARNGPVGRQSTPVAYGPDPSLGESAPIAGPPKSVAGHAYACANLLDESARLASIDGIPGHAAWIIAMPVMFMRLLSGWALREKAPSL